MLPPRNRLSNWLISNGIVKRMGRWCGVRSGCIRLVGNLGMGDGEDGSHEEASMPPPPAPGTSQSPSEEMMPPPPVPGMPRSPPAEMMPPPPRLAHIGTPRPPASRWPSSEADGVNVSPPAGLGKEARERLAKLEPALQELEVKTQEGAKNNDTEPRKIAGYEAPPWSSPPDGEYGFEVIRGGVLVGTEQVSRADRGYFLLGRSAEDVDLHLAHPSISRIHAAIQFRRGDSLAYVIDLNSTHGTFVNKKQIKSSKYVALSIGDMLKFGESTRLYILKGPPDATVQAVNATREAPSIEAQAAKAEAMQRKSLQQVSWGFGEDAVDEEEDEEAQGGNIEELLPEKLSKKQQQMLEKIEVKKNKLMAMEGELQNIRNKETSSELTDGQVNRISMLEERMGKLEEEIENGYANIRANSQSSEPKNASRKKNEDLDSYNEEDDDTFFDRTEDLPSSGKSSKAGEVETEKSLREKVSRLSSAFETITKELHEAEETLKQLSCDGGDSLDAFMKSNEINMATDRRNVVKRRWDTKRAELENARKLLAVATNTTLDAIPNFSASAVPTSAASKPLPVVEPLWIPGEDESMVRDEEASRADELPQIAKQPDGKLAAPLDGKDFQGQKEEPSGGTTKQKAPENAPPQPPRKRVAGPSMPPPPKKAPRVDTEEFFNWKPPENQSGDGKNSLNEKFGY